MARPVTLFTGQWADLPFETICHKAKQFGYDGVELACWGDHFEVDKALKDKNYCQGPLGHPQQARPQGLRHLHPPRRPGRLRPHRRTPQADPARRRLGRRRTRRRPPARRQEDDRHRQGLPELLRRRPAKTTGFPAVVNGFTGSSIWHSIYAFPPTDQKYWQKGFDDFAKRWTPILERVRKAQRQLRPGSPSHRNRLRHRLRPARRRGRQGPQALRLQLRPLPPRLPGRRLREVHPHVRPTASSTST